MTKKTASKAKPDRTKKDKQFLSIKLTKNEVVDRQVKLAKAQKKLDAALDEKKELNAELNARIKNLRAEMSVLARAALNGIEDREVKTEHRYYDDNGIVQTVRLDNGELVESRKQTEDDMQHEMFGDE